MKKIKINSKTNFVDRVNLYHKIVNVKSEKEFRATVVDKNLTSTWGVIVIHSNGTISGDAKSSNDKLSGVWKWSNKKWCRNLKIGAGDPLGSQCMKISVSDESTLHIKGNGNPTVFAIGN